MVSKFCPDRMEEDVYNRYGEYIGKFKLKEGYWEFISCPNKRERLLTIGETSYVESRQGVLNQK